MHRELDRIPPLQFCLLRVEWWGSGTAAQNCGAPSLEVSKPGWMGPWAAWAGGDSQPTAWGWNWMVFKVPPNLSYFMILSYDWFHWDNSRMYFQDIGSGWLSLKAWLNLCRYWEQKDPVRVQMLHSRFAEWIKKFFIQHFFFDFAFRKKKWKPVRNSLQEKLCLQYFIHRCDADHISWHFIRSLT